MAQNKEKPTSQEQFDEAEALVSRFENLEVRAGELDFHMSKTNAVLTYPDVASLKDRLESLIERLRAIN